LFAQYVPVRRPVLDHALFLVLLRRKVAASTKILIDRRGRGIAGIGAGSHSGGNAHSQQQ
jgi:hypothetical protein